jgi:hypothetical protein
VLRPGGHFLYADSRRAPDVAGWEAALAGAPLQKISERAVEEACRRALAANTRAPGRSFDHRVPAFVRTSIRYGIGVLDWDLRRAGGFSYRVYCFVKD